MPRPHLKGTVDVVYQMVLVKVEFNFSEEFGDDEPPQFPTCQPFGLFLLDVFLS